MIDAPTKRFLRAKEMTVDDREPIPYDTRLNRWIA